MKMIQLILIISLILILLVVNVSGFNTINEINIEDYFNISTEKEDKYLNSELIYKGDNTFELIITDKKTIKPKEYEWGVSICIPSGELTKHELLTTNTKLEVKDTKIEWCKETYNKGFNILSKETKTDLHKVTFTIPEGTKDFKIYGGDASFVHVVNSTTEGYINTAGYIDRGPFYDTVNNRWIIVYINGTGTRSIQTYSSSDYITWVPGATFTTKSSGYNYATFDCMIDNRESNSYLHCGYTARLADNFQYVRCENTASGNYISCGIEQTPFDATILIPSAQSIDRAPYLGITQDSNNCVIFAFDYYNSSRAALSQHTVTLIKEAETCGDGIFNTSTIASGYPKYNVQSELGFGFIFPIDIKPFAEKQGFQLAYIDSDSVASADLLNIYFNSSTDTTGTERLLDADVEWSSSQGQFALSVMGDVSYNYAMDDGTQDLDAYIITTRDGALTRQTDTGLNVGDAATTDVAQVVADCDPINGSNCWVFAVEDADDEDINYAITNDEGVSYGNQTLWIDEGSPAEIKYMSSHFNTETCEFSVMWLSGSSTPWETRAAKILGGSDCGTPPPVNNTCTCPVDGDWIVDCSDNCNITGACDITGNSLIINGASGMFNIMEDIHCDFYASQKGCQVINIPNDGNELIIKK